MQITSLQSLQGLMWHATPKLSMQHRLDFVAVYQRPAPSEAGLAGKLEDIAPLGITHSVVCV